MALGLVGTAIPGNPNPQANHYNAFNETYVATAVTKTFVYPGNPRNWRASVSYSF